MQLFLQLALLLLHPPLIFQEFALLHLQRLYLLLAGLVLFLQFCQSGQQRIALEGRSMEGRLLCKAVLCLRS